jgi:hypothetical protein
LNESWGVSHLATSPQQRDYATMLFHLTKALDPSRPVISNDGWEHTTTDLIGVHDYGPDPEALRHRYADQEVTAHQLLHGRPGLRRVLLDSADYHGQPVVVSEFGGLSYQPDGSQPWFGYATVPTPDALLKTFEALVDALLASPTLAGFCYTQLADTEQENNGLVTCTAHPRCRRSGSRPPCGAPPVPTPSSWSRPSAQRHGRPRRYERTPVARPPTDPPGSPLRPRTAGHMPATERVACASLSECPSRWYDRPRRAPATRWRCCRRRSRRRPSHPRSTSRR